MHVQIVYILRPISLNIFNGIGRVLYIVFLACIVYVFVGGVLLDGSERIRFSNRRVWDVLTNVVFPRKAENFGCHGRFVLEFSALKLFDR